MDLVAGIAVHVMPCHDCGIYSKHLWTLYHDACETIFFHYLVMLYLYIIIIIKCMWSRCRRDDIHVCFAYASPQRMPHM